jgi:uncharacterized glyoxalase superfamily protein PhnB
MTNELAVFLARRKNPSPSVLNAHCDKTAFIDTVFAEYTEKGAFIDEPPSARPWGLYEMRVLDLDGNVMRMQAFSDKADTIGGK